ncbi:MAG: hypothetical protein EWV58_02165 [Microcystis aeruginosa Ma_MB_F_20061100_S19]|uniref:Uncharacterized protein n=1 Tax=Microcystis aeruginosa SPC777 TaxID=482300 RepID=S3JDU3_MICAE|nr:hypothetical protein [Microcystis aeruginosa]EPF23943.1 hypothetical protein MAESPC_00896 [Microcystis aeruginosa SPC777]OCY15194.1 MAG: hypothetical protein BEV12_15785 [Microcystis aeruginosa CACIAM 03]TRU15548.1 MAG: hypothetical protein EWV59_03530 [Microcystis aeruginosa Ma_MB_F_20061100_S19D]TRU18337.1 MAG: hypothetical protein EWV58_02165 [Microcystis aeruginosa Ma_MB_F_20061100_S19]
MYKDEIVEEIHKYREEYAKSFNYDLKAIFDDLREKQIASGRKVIKLPTKRQYNKSLHPTESAIVFTH